MSRSSLLLVKLESNPGNCEFRQFVSGGVYSFEVGALKMDDCVMLDAFEARYGRPAAFFDDRVEIVARAVAYGWNAIQFTTPEDFLQDVSKMF